MPEARQRRSDLEPGSERRTRLLLVTNMYPTPDRPHIGPFVARRVASLRAAGVEVVVAGPSGYGGSAALRHLRIVWRALTARGRFDGVEAHPLYAAGVIGLVAARLRRRPLLAYAHGGDVADYAMRSRIHRSLAGLVARHADAVVTNSADTAGYVERLGATARVIPPGVDMTEFCPPAGGAAERRALREQLGLPQGLVALLLGTLSERKGADVFAAAIELAAAGAGGPGWAGVMVGDGPLAADLAAAHPSLDQRGAVPADQVPAWLRAVDVVVVPSRREPLGLAAVEALASGTPVVASSVGGLLDVVRDGENGLLIPPDDPAALAAALRRLGDAKLRRRLEEAGPASVARHDLRTVTGEMAEVWLELGVKT
jgi:glycosyltransferase involved in cell wall biosynthesis